MKGEEEDEEMMFEMQEIWWRVRIRLRLKLKVMSVDEDFKIQRAGLSYAAAAEQKERMKKHAQNHDRTPHSSPPLTTSSPHNLL